MDDSHFPQVELLATVRDPFGIPVQGLFAKHFTLSESGKPISNLDVMPIYEQPLDLVLVLDTSASTGYGADPTALQSAARAARNLVNSLGEKDRAAVVAFGNKATTIQPLTLNKHPINASLSLLEPAGDSALNDAVLTGLNLLGGSPRPLILLFTDGPDSGRSLTSTSLVAQAAVEKRVPVFIIGWRTANTRELQNLAALSGGSFQFLDGNTPSAEDLQAAINTLQPAIKELRGQYHITFNSSLQADDQEHPLQVQVNNEGHRQNAETSFKAVSQQVGIDFPGLQEGQVVGGIIQLSLQVSAPAPLVSLELLMDGKLIAELDALTRETIYDTAALAPGPHRLSARAQDSAGNKGRLDVSLEVQPPITVALLSPAPDEQFRDITSLSARVTAIPAVERVEFWLDERLIASREAPPYEVSWNPAGTPPGEHTIRLVAYDIQGHKAEVTREIRITGNNPLPALLAALLILLGTATIIIVPLRLRRGLKKREQAISEIFARRPAFLREVEGVEPGRVWKLDKDEIRLGRKREENDIPLKGLSSARRQAIIRYAEGEYIITSLYPEKPALVNEIPAHPQAVLQSGDTLRLGETVLHFEMQE